MQHRPAASEPPAPDEVVELRVHGVGGASPEELLDVPLTVRVAGDPAAGFFRPWLDQGRRPVLEGYSWGGLTSASRLRALWVLLTPFALVNLAGWMICHGGRPDDTGPRRRAPLESVAVALVRLFGLLVTAGMVGHVVVGSLDLIAYQCGARPTCADGRWWMSPFANRLVDGRLGSVLAVGAVLVAVVVAGIAWVARRSQQSIHPGRARAGYGGVDDPTFTVNLSHAALWESPHVPHRLGLLHLAAGMASVGVPLAHVSARLGLLGGGAMETVGWVVLGGVVIAILRLDGVPPLVHAALAIAAGTQLVATIALVAGTDAQPEPGPLAGVRVVSDLLLPAVPLVALGAGAAMVVLWRRQRTTPLRVALVAPALLLAGSGLVDAFGSGILIRLADLLGTPVVDSDYPLEGATTQPPIVYSDLVGDVAVLTVVTLLVLMVVGAVLWWRAGAGPACEVLSERFADRGGLDCDDPADRAWARRVGRAQALAGLTDLVAAVVTWVTAGVVVVVAVAVLAGGDDSGLRLGSWADRLAGPASVVLGALPLVAVWGITRLYRSRAVRRVVGVLWDVSVFWPRWFHPWSPPAYGERAVPQLVDRMAVLTERSEAVVSAHSQGSVLAVAALALSPRQVLDRVALLTHGSPLDRLYARFFPEYLSGESFGHMAEAVPWINLWRVTDFVGGPVDAPGVEDVAVVDPPSSRPAARGEARPVPLRHSDFDTTPEYRTALATLIGRLDGSGRGGRAGS